MGLPKYHKIIKLKVNFLHFIVLLADINKHYLLALVTNDSRIIIIIIITIIITIMITIIIITAKFRQILREFRTINAKF